MLSRGHEVLINSRDKEVCFALLNSYKIPFISLGRDRNSTIGKLLCMFHADLMLFNHARKFKPNVFL